MKLGLQNNIARTEPPWTQSPRTLISLWDMIKFDATEVLNILAAIDHYSNNNVPAGQFVDEASKKSVTELIVKVRSLSQRIELPSTMQVATLFFRKASPKSNLPNEVLKSSLEDLRTTFIAELSEKLFLFCPNAQAKFFNSNALFGELVNSNFPSAREDIKSAGNCLVADLNTAAVFHLMRVLEFGLRSLAFHLRAKTIIKQLKQTKIPIELGTWDEVIKTAQSKVDALKTSGPRSHKRESEIGFYDEILSDYRAVKDLWRNKVMHARDTYDADRAKSAFDHVKAFMERLAIRVTENN